MVFLATSSMMMSTVMSHCNCPHSCLIAYFPFEGDAADSSGNNRDGTSTGAVTYANGKCGQAASFDGASKIDVQSLANFAWGDEFSVSVWFKRTGQWGNYQGIVNNGYGTNGGWEIRMGRENSGQMLGGSVFETATGPWDYQNLVGAQNTWNHVVMTYDDSTLRYYLNGEQQTATNPACCNGPIPTRNNPVTIGQAGFGTTVEYFHGLIDEVKIYGRVLSAAEIQNMAIHACL
ncbi:uncharacterized protein LOC115918963 [Strongylocentrotus purpuratus]|nr:uncharacterized protein LOC115918963 [Strongylocentrotus purpuratus]